MQLTRLIEEISSQAGGGVALAFIVLLGLGIATMMAVYLASAVAVLDRFARVSRRGRPRVLAAAAMAAVAAMLGQRVVRPELAVADWGEWGRSLALALPIAGVATAAAMAIVRALIDRVPPGRLASVAGLWASLGLALVLLGTGNALLPLAVAAALLAALLVSAWLRRRRNGAGPGEGEGFVGRAGAIFGLVAPLALLPTSFVDALGAFGAGLACVLGLLVLLGLLPRAAGGFVDMRGSAEWFIAARYLVAKRRQVFISAITGICVVAIAAGVWLIIVVLSVMNGFEQTWRDEILGDRAHFVVGSEEGPIRDWPAVLERTRAVEGVVAAAPFIDVDAMVRGRAGEIHSVRLRGIDPDAVGGVTNLRDDMISGALDAVVTERREVGPDEDVNPGVVIGNQLSSALGVGVGDSLLVISPLGGPPTPLGPAPRLARFDVVGVFRSSFYQYDEVYAYVSIPAAQRFRKADDVIDGIEAITTDYYRSGAVGGAVAAALGEPFTTTDWKQYFPAFFQALKTERVMMAVLLTMIMVVAAFVVVATLMMMIMEKSGDIAILKAMGAEDAAVERIFALEGTLIGLLGTVLGVVAGLAFTHRLAWIQDRIEALTGVDALPATVYQFSSLPSRVDPLQVAVVVTLAMVLSLGATLLPSRQGARIDPAEGLRHE